jgi:addiction module HigA family antidote
MKELGVSQTELAKRMQVSRPYITKVLHQDVNITFRTAAKLAAALKMDFCPDLRLQESQEVTQKLPNMV